ncbi:hypothetical protein M758_8G155200 [Ceratodon purpureus]|nr:hypothetical protein M758_8G155200 [Ceratodon purpureus]
MRLLVLSCCFVLVFFCKGEGGRSLIEEFHGVGFGFRGCMCVGSEVNWLGELVPNRRLGWGSPGFIFIFIFISFGVWRRLMYFRRKVMGLVLRRMIFDF